MMKGQTIWVTGCNGALGPSVVKVLLDRGATVVGTDAKARPNDFGERFSFQQADLTDESAVESVVTGFAKVDALVHLVGGFTMGPVDDLELDAFRAHFDLQVVTTLLCCKHALRRMKAAGYGRIVTVASKAVEEPAAQIATYAISKAGVLALTRVVAAETKGTDITANCVAPSIIDTPANRQAMGDADAHRWVSPESLAEHIAFLASPQARDARGTLSRIYGSV